MSCVDFDGSTFVATKDEARLSTQLEAVRALMCAGEWRSLSGISGLVGAPEASVSSRLRDLRKPKHGAWRVERKRLVAGLHLYRMLPPLPDGQLKLLEVSK